jgi:glucosylceramidase
LGWGGAFTDAAGINIDSLNEQLQEKLLRSYFADDGIEYSLCRVPIGGTDFSTRGYSYDDGDVDEDLVNFALADEDHQYKVLRY